MKKLIAIIVSFFLLLTSFSRVQSAFTILETINPTNSSSLQYGSVYDGYLWLVLSNGQNVVKKLSIATGQEVASATKSGLWYEMFSAYCHSGVVYIPGCKGYAAGDGLIQTYDEASLSEIHCYQDVGESANLFVQAIYDPVHGRMLFGADMLDETYTIYACDPVNIRSDSAYYPVKIDNCPDPVANGGSETSIRIFRNTVYVLCTSPCGGGTQPMRTRLYSSGDLVHWNLAWEKTCQTNGWGSYFAHITSSNDWLVAGVISGTTYRIEYWNNAGAWREYDTMIPETSGEDHPNVNMLTNSLVLFECSQRDGDNSHKVFTFDCATQAFTNVLTLASTGYNDRIVTSDEKGAIYVSDGHAFMKSGAQVFKIQTSTPPIMEKGSIMVKGVNNSVPVSFEAWYNRNGQASTHVTVTTSGYTWPNLDIGFYTVYGKYGGVEKSYPITVSKDQIATHTFDFFSGGVEENETSWWDEFLAWLQSNLYLDLRLLFIAGFVVVVVLGMVIVRKRSSHASARSAR